MAYVELSKIGKSYGKKTGRTEVLRDVNLEIQEGEFVAVVGFSGAGKTTLVSMIAGLIAPDTGVVSVAGKKITGPGTDRGVVFQNYSLLPWETAEGNVRLAVEQAFPKAPSAEMAGSPVSRERCWMTVPLSAPRAGSCAIDAAVNWAT